MNDMKQHIDELVGDLKRERDELRLKMGLAKLEAVDEWHDLETKLAKLESKAKSVGGATAEASQDVGAAAKLLGEEIRKGFKAVSKRLK
jgi:hypothetical protein